MTKSLIFLNWVSIFYLLICSFIGGLELGGIVGSFFVIVSLGVIIRFLNFNHGHPLYY